jgi:hypothetical protein
MKKWLRGIRGAVLMGLTWAAVWAPVAVLIGIAARRRRFNELSLSRFAAWGALAGLLIGVLPFTLGDVNTERPLWLLGVVIIGSIALLGAVSAAGSLALARMAEKRELPDAKADVAEVGRTGGEAEDLRVFRS